MQTVKFKTEQFEGPLDVLLYLISKHRMDLYDIKIYELIEQYLDFMGSLGPEQLDPTSEFVEMAARLVYMKSAALLPKRDEAEQLERELTGQLVEYHLCKRAAARLGSMSDGVLFFVREPLDVELPADFDMSCDPAMLVAALGGISGRALKLRAPDPTSDFEPLVTAPVVSVTSRIIRILRGLRSGTAKRVFDFFDACRTKSETVATFLGVLELMRAGRIAVDDDGNVTTRDSHRRRKSR